MKKRAKQKKNKSFWRKVFLVENIPFLIIGSILLVVFLASTDILTDI